MPPSNQNSQYLPPLFHRLPFYYGWVIVSIATLATFIGGPGQTYTFSVFINPIIEETSWSRSTVAGLYTAGSLTAAAGIFLVGRTLDKLGARTMLVAVGVLLGGGAWWMSSVSTAAGLYLGFAIMRLLGQGSMTLIPETLIALWFVRMRGKVMAINALGSVISHAVFPVILFSLIESVGWRSTYFYVGLFVWGIFVLPAFLFVRRTPESVGLLPDGDGVSAAISGKPGVASQNQQKPVTLAIEANFSLRQALHTRSFYLLLFAGSSVSMITTALVFHQVSVVTTKGLPSNLAPTLFLVQAMMGLFGNFLAGFLLDRVPNRFVLAFGQAILASAMLIALMISTEWHALIYAGLLGLSGGIHITTNAVIWPNYYGRQHLGSIRGVASTAMVASAALGPWPFGVLFDHTGNYTMAISMFFVLPIACAISAILATPPKSHLYI